MSQLLGNLFIVAAPSGAGKSSLISALLRQDAVSSSSQMCVSVSHTTRAPRPAERDGEHYHFVSRDAFEALIAQHAFFEWAEVFGNYYGTSRLAIEEHLQQGKDVFLDIDWQGARQVKQQHPDACGIFILPPSIATLRQRLEQRAQDSAEVIEKRMRQAQDEMRHYDEFDFVIINDDFDTALQQLNSIVTARGLRQVKQTQRHHALLSALLTD